MLRGGARRRSCCDPITSNLYDAAQPGELPEKPCWLALAAAIPPRWPNLNPGETVLDLGSGGGIDVLLSARRVGPTGKAYGLDMTDEMLALANANKRQGRRRERRVPERAKSKTFRCPITRSMSSFPTASSISPPTRTACCAKPSAC